MAVAYVVRCRFIDAGREQAWNDWYSGPKLMQMLEKPMFLNGQRFRLLAGDGRDYLAFWTLESAAAFETPEYTSDWGFFEWRPFITDWSRDLFAPAGGALAAPAAGPDDRLHLVAYDGVAAEEAAQDRSRLAAARPNLTWLSIVGLDRHTPLMAYEVVRGDTLPSLPATSVRRRQALYRPISRFAEAVGATKGS